jgi:UDP-N-acetylmuramoyl-L-alanyl-D-glutamate--2,6-diaminopimelate ligase
MGAAAGSLADVVVLTSDNPRSEDPDTIISEILPGLSECTAQVHVEPDRVRAIRWALKQGRPGDVIVLAGKGHETSQEISGVCHHLDEREIVADYFQRQPAKKTKKSS